MNNAVSFIKTNVRITLSFLFVINLAALTGCTLSVPDQPIAQQNADLQDQDNDGVINARDKCADTPYGAAIDNRGCADVIKFNAMNNLHILFPSGSAVIPSSFNREVYELAQFMNTFQDTMVKLKGYASPAGSSESNIALSKARSESVRKELVRKGIQANRINIESYGETDPVESNSEMQTEMLSRRVVARIKVTEDIVEKKWNIYSTEKYK